MDVETDVLNQLQESNVQYIMGCRTSHMVWDVIETARRVDEANHSPHAFVLHDRRDIHFLSCTTNLYHALSKNYIATNLFAKITKVTNKKPFQKESR